MLFLVILLFALFSSVFTLSKQALLYSEPFFFIGSRMLVAGLILICYLALKQSDELKKIKPRDIAPLFLLGLFNIYLTNIAEIWGLKHMNSSKVCLIYSLTPFMAAFIAYFVLNERLSLRKWFGMLIGFLGLAPIFSMQSLAEIHAGTFWFFSFGELAIFIAVLTSVYGWILLKKLITQHDLSPLTANGMSMVLGGSLAILHAYFSGESFSPIPVSELGAFLFYMLIICFISSIICFNLYGFLLKYFTATFMSFAGLVSPFFAAFYGSFFLGEQISWHFFISMILFSVGLLIFYQEEIKKGQSYKIKPKAAIF